MTAPKYLARAASLTVATSLDGKRYDTMFRRDPDLLEQIVDIGVTTKARFVRVSLQGDVTLHFRQLIVS